MKEADLIDLYVEAMKLPPPRIAVAPEFIVRIWEIEARANKGPGLCYGDLRLIEMRLNEPRP